MLTDSSPDHLPPIESHEFLPPVGRWITLGGWGLAATVVGSMTLAAVTPYRTVVKAEAIARPTGELRIVQATAEGRIQQIQVRENQEVKKGDPIAQIESSATQTQKQQLQAAVQSAVQQQSQIQAQIRAVDQQIAAESRLMERTVAASDSNLSRNQRAYQEQQSIAASQFQEMQSALDFAQTEMQRYQALAQTGAIAELQVKEKEQAFRAAQARLARARAALNPSNAEVTIAQEQIAQEQAKGQSTIAALQQNRSNLFQQETELKAQLQKNQQSLQQMERNLKQNSIVAPDDGIVLKLELRNPGQVVHIGDSIAQLAPTHAPMTIKAKVSVQDIAQVKVCSAKQVADCQIGQVFLRISAYPYPDYGVLKGAVRAVSADAISVHESGAKSYYEVTIQPEITYLERQNDSSRDLSSLQKFPIQPGMEMQAEIVAKQETFLSFLLRKVRLLSNF